MPAPSFMIERLNAETRSHHCEADAAFDVLFAPRTGPSQYIAYLSCAFGFEYPLEQALVATPGLSELLDLDARVRSTRIAGDLMALGVLPTEVASLATCLSIPHFRGAAEALGWMYVVERTTLSHSLVRRHLATVMPRELNKAAGYLSSYAGVVGTRWRELGEALDLVAQHPSIADRVVAAAHDAFRCQHRWTLQDHRSLQRATG